MLRNLKAAFSILSLLSFIFLIGAGINVMKSADAEEAVVSSSVDLTDSEIKTLMQDFMNRLVQPTDEEYRVENFPTKEELITYFLEISNRETAEMFINEYYYEEKGGLFIIPTETPPWLEPEHEFDLKKLDNHNYRLTQTNETDLYGTYTITVTFSYENGRWIITDVLYGNSL